MINKLQDVFNTVGADIIQLPQIAVVGTQVKRLGCLAKGCCANERASDDERLSLIFLVDISPSTHTADTR